MNIVCIHICFLYTHIGDFCRYLLVLLKVTAAVFLLCTNKLQQTEVVAQLNLDHTIKPFIRTQELFQGWEEMEMQKDPFQVVGRRGTRKQQKQVGKFVVLKCKIECNVILMVMIR